MVKNPPVNAGDVASIPGSGRSPRREWQPNPGFLPEKSHGQRSLAGYSPWARKESDMTEQLSVHTHIWSKVFNRGAKTIQWGKVGVVNKGC